MREPIISVREISKFFYINTRQKNRYSTLRDDIVEATRNLRIKNEKRHKNEKFWALKDISFDVYPGEIVGIIGHNGAGKSTLLKILSRITPPSSGEALIRGRATSLLEVGTGFHPELNGRENIFMSGAILGMSQKDIKAQFQNIIEFSEIEKFIEVPVKYYSSGMYVRLAFSVAAHLTSDILLVDEILAVGDTNFQRKCVSILEDLHHTNSKTIIFVSHNIALVRQLCQRGILLGNGELEIDSNINTTLSKYFETKTRKNHRNNDRSSQDESLILDEVYLLSDNQVVDELDFREDFQICINYQVVKPIYRLRFGFSIYHQDGFLMFASNDPNSWLRDITQPGRYQAICKVPGFVLNQGLYYLSIGVDAYPHEALMLKLEHELDFKIYDLEKHGPLQETLPGLVRPKLLWSNKIL